MICLFVIFARCVSLRVYGFIIAETNLQFSDKSPTTNHNQVNWAWYVVWSDQMWYGRRKNALPPAPCHRNEALPFALCLSRVPTLPAHARLPRSSRALRCCTSPSNNCAGGPHTVVGPARIHKAHAHAHACTCTYDLLMCACAGRQQARAARQQGCEWLGNPKCMCVMEAG